LAIRPDRHGIHDADTREIEAILAEVTGESLAGRERSNDDEFLDIVREVLPGRRGRPRVGASFV
jgi:hypothetical protein